MELNYHHLRYFWHVARSGHLSATARQLHVSQSALSTQIRTLEERLGEPLFDRSQRRLRLTEAGQHVYAHAERIFAEGEALMTRLRSGQLAARDTLRLGAVTTLSRNFLELFVEPLLKREDSFFSIATGSLNDLLPRLARHELDVVLTHIPVAPEDRLRWRSQRLGVQSVSVVGRPGERFELPHGLEAHRLLLPGPSSAIRTAFDLQCEGWGIRPQVLAEVDDMAMLRLLARDAPALAVLPAIVVRDEIQAGSLVEYATLPGLEEQFFAVTLPREHPPPRVIELIDHARALLAGNRQPSG